MNKIIKYLLFILIFTYAYKLQYAQTEKYKLTVLIEGIKKQRGKLDVTLYKNPKSFPKDTGEYMSKSVFVNSETEKCIFIVSKGYYAIALYHDENNNNDCDMNFFGLPTEGIGFSNNIRPILSAPSFKSCQFYVSKNMAIHIHLLYY